MVNINKFSIGATAAITTSMGLIAGLSHGDGAKTGIITGLLIIAIADNVSDTLGLHIYKESEGASKQETSSFTYGNFIVRFLLASTFVLIVLLFSPVTAFVISSVWGLFLLSILSYLIAKSKKINHWQQIFRHVLVAVLVIIGSKLLGGLILKVITHS